MKTLIVFFSAILFFVVCFFPLGCKKDSLGVDKPSDSFQISERSESLNEFYSGGTTEEDTLTKLTVLGNVRNNPYTVQNFTAAYNELYEPDIQSLPVTHHYIKFLPANQEEMIVLAKSDLNLYEYPLDREVIEMGDYYKEPGSPKDQISPFYAVVTPSQALPNLSYEILSELHLRSNDEDLVRRALERVGYDPDVVGYILPGEPGDNGGSGGSEFEINSCGCHVYKEQRMPGGCIQVKDVEKDIFQGVRRVKVILKDTWFTEDETWTDDNGCFRINNKYYGKAWMWVKFKSPRVQIRGARSGFAAVWEWAFPVKDYVGQVSGPRFNDIQVKYDIWSNQGSSAHIHWGAATVNNALHEFHDYAIADGINPPPPFLDIYVGRNHSYGYALMSGQNMIAQAVFIVLIQTSYFAGPFGPLIAIIGASAVQSYLPDVYVGIEFNNSDRLKWLAYHEIAHASHWTKAGVSFWNELVNAEVAAKGHGNAGSNNAGLISLVESWAEHIGLSYSHRTYETATSYYITVIERLERTRNESPNHIPIGFYHDLIDNVPDIVNACDVQGGGCGPINDQASGFTNSQMFGLLTSGTKSPLNFKDKLIQGASPATQTQVNNLFNSY